jgi:hypothetical protein
MQLRWLLLQLLQLPAKQLHRQEAAAAPPAPAAAAAAAAAGCAAAGSCRHDLQAAAAKRGHGKRVTVTQFSQAVGGVSDNLAMGQMDVSICHHDNSTHAQDEIDLANPIR